MKSESEVTQLCLTLRDPIDCSLPGFSVHGVFQARVLEWVAIAFSVTNLDSILKSRDITLLTKVCIVKAMVFPVLMYGWGEGDGTPLSALAWEIPWTEQPGGMQSNGS